MRLSWTGRLLVIGSAVVTACWAPDATHLVSALGGPSFPEALIAAGSLITVALSVWVLGVATLIWIGASSRVVSRLTPRVLQGALMAGATGALIVNPAHAVHVAGPEVPLHHSVSGLPLPDRPDTATVERPRTPAPEAADRYVVVRPGDTLWSLAARSLPDDADGPHIAAAAAAWHDTNRAVIGDDPDLIFPTQRLVPPTGKDLP